MAYERATNLLRLFEAQPQQQINQVVIGVGDFKYLVRRTPNAATWTIYYGTSGQQAQPHGQPYKSFSEAFSAVGQALAPSFASSTAPEPEEEEEEEDQGDRIMRKFAQRAQRPGAAATPA